MPMVERLTRNPSQEAPEVEEALLLTLPESWFFLVVGFFWTQTTFAFAYAASQGAWPVWLSVADSVVLATRVVVRHWIVRETSRKSRIIRRFLLPSLAAWISIVAVLTFGLFSILDIRTTVLGALTGCGCMGYVVSRFAAVPRLALVLITILTAALTLGVSLSPWADLHSVGWITPLIAFGFSVIMYQNHDIMVGAFRAQQQNRQLSLHDPLTGLANRLLMRERLEALCRDVAAGDQTGGFAMLCIDLDGFKDVNDRFGHAAGDGILVRVAELLRTALRTGDTVSRIGGDEFVVLLPDVDMETALLLAQSIVSAGRISYDLGLAVLVRISLSVGVALCPLHGIEPEVLLSRADEALYDVKRGGKGTWRMAGAQPSDAVCQDAALRRA